MAEKLVNVSLTLTESQIKYLERQERKTQLKRSPYVRVLINKDMAAEKSKK